jgi:hypothetical protein
MLGLSSSRVGNLFQAFGDDLSRLQGPLGQGRIFDYLVLHPRGLSMQRVAQGLQLRDEFLDLLHRGSVARCSTALMLLATISL